MANAKICNSCGKNISNDSGSAVFKCPNCLEGVVIRCVGCRKLATKYTCPSCGFEGPN